MKNKRNLSLIMTLLAAIFLPSIVDAGNLKKKYINIAKEGEAATVTDLPSNYVNPNLNTLLETSIVHDYAMGNTGRIQGAKRVNDPEKGMVMQFNGTTDKIVTPLDPKLGNTGDFTFETWVKFNELNGSNRNVHSLISTYSAISPYTGKGIELYVWNHYLYLHVGAGVHSVTTLQSNTWYHVAGTRKNGLATVYINGVANASGNLPNNATETLLTLGNGYNYTSEALSGYMKETRVWNYARSSEEIKDFMNKELQGNEKGLIGYWKLN